MEIKTVYDVRDLYREVNPEGHFFDKDTMKFWGNRYKDMYLIRPTQNIIDYRGNTHECYTLRIRHRNNGLGTCYYYFDTNTLKEVMPYTE